MHSAHLYITFSLSPPSPSSKFASVCLSLDLLEPPACGQVSDRGCSGRAFLGHQKAKRETASVTLCRASFSPPLIESSDPKLMRWGAGAHLLSTADVLHGQTGEQRWQCWIRSVGSDKPLHTLTRLLISHSVFTIVSKRNRAAHSIHIRVKYCPWVDSLRFTAAALACLVIQDIIPKLITLYSAFLPTLRFRISNYT